MTGPEVMFVLKPSALFKSIYFWTKSRHFELPWWLRATLQSLSSTKRLVTLFFCTELLWVSCKLLHIEYLGTASNGAGNSSANSWKKNSLYLSKWLTRSTFSSIWLGLTMKEIRTVWTLIYIFSLQGEISGLAGWVY